MHQLDHPFEYSPLLNFTLQQLQIWGLSHKILCSFALMTTDCRISGKIRFANRRNAIQEISMTGRSSVYRSQAISGDHYSCTPATSSRPKNASRQSRLARKHNHDIVWTQWCTDNLTCQNKQHCLLFHSAAPTLEAIMLSARREQSEKHGMPNCRHGQGR
jgi:hypothetical protein